MQSRRCHSWPGTILLLLALLSVLLAPMVSVSHAGGHHATPPAAAMDDQQHDGCGDCGDHQDQSEDGDCCTSSACSCACHAPLTTRLQFSPLVPVYLQAALEPAQRLPLVYLAIFVPPQNRS